MSPAGSTVWRMIESGFPILEVDDLARAIEFYERVLGGTVEYRFPDDGEPVYLSLAMGSSRLGIGMADTPLKPQGGCCGSMWMMSIG